MRERGQICNLDIVQACHDYRFAPSRTLKQINVLHPAAIYPGKRIRQV